MTEVLHESQMSYIGFKVVILAAERDFSRSSLRCSRLCLDVERHCLTSLQPFRFEIQCMSLMRSDAELNIIRGCYITPEPLFTF